MLFTPLLVSFSNHRGTGPVNGFSLPRNHKSAFPSHLTCGSQFFKYSSFCLNSQLSLTPQDHLLVPPHPRGGRPQLRPQRSSHGPAARFGGGAGCGACSGHGSGRHHSTQVRATVVIQIHTALIYQGIRHRGWDSDSSSKGEQPADVEAAPPNRYWCI